MDPPSQKKKSVITKVPTTILKGLKFVLKGDWNLNELKINLPKHEDCWV